MSLTQLIGVISIVLAGGPIIGYLITQDEKATCGLMVALGVLGMIFAVFRLAFGQ